MNPSLWKAEVIKHWNLQLKLCGQVNMWRVSISMLGDENWDLHLSLSLSFAHVCLHVDMCLFVRMIQVCRCLYKSMELWTCNYCASDKQLVEVTLSLTLSLALALSLSLGLPACVYVCVIQVCRSLYRLLEFWSCDNFISDNLLLEVSFLHFLPWDVWVIFSSAVQK